MTLLSASKRALTLSPLALLAFLPSVCDSSQLETRAAEAVPAPLVFTPDQNWDGIDGQWSSFTLRVGSPQQFVRVFPATSSQQIWVVKPEGCAYTQDTSCPSDRGWVFNISQSSTWETIGNYSTWAERNLGYDAAATYGYETVGLMGEGENGPTLVNATVGAMMDLDFFLGVFGLHPKPTNFSSFNNPSPSYMTLLKDQGVIPSLSYGYTAGNQYRLNKVLGSLTLGGYDASKFTPNNMSFSFAPDNERDTVVGLQAISMTSATKPNVDLLPTAITMYIDSTVPQIWLPVDACERFEDAFGLTYDNQTDLYLVNDTLHDTLVAQNANVTFTLGHTTSGGDTIDIVLPYAAFDLTAQPPYRGLSESTSYFPIRRGHNESQYVFGRTFLQEAYIVVDHERSNFSVSQCVFGLGIGQNVTTIYVPDNGTSTSSSEEADERALSTAAIAGISVGGVVAILAVLSLIGLFYWRRRYRALKAKLGSDKSGSASTGDGSSDAQAAALAAGGQGEESTLVIPKAELDATPGARARQAEKDQKQDLPTRMHPSEVEANELRIFEMPGDYPKASEADSRELSEKQAAMFREQKYNGTNPEPSPTTPTAPERLRPSPVRPEEVRRVIHTADFPVSPLAAEGEHGRTFSPLSPLGGSSSGEPSPSRRRFSFEE
ncbi:acid protease [Diplodia corticola]|uniref:Acid protease n=1 Tax=Diplodia corticola TaxID=236234 RepID=A0A1J9RRM9_9PEZI|nr:acid protease [Diplodia corticola]OJD30181.1 acid protease [Diplodia corticola]